MQSDIVVRYLTTYCSTAVCKTCRLMPCHGTRPRLRLKIKRKRKKKERKKAVTERFKLHGLHCVKPTIFFENYESL